MKRTVHLVLFCVLAALPARAADACKPIPGSDALWANPKTRYIFVGELHGTKEAPAIFGDLVCAAFASKRPVIVGVEHAVSEQPALDAFMASSGDAQSAAALKREMVSSGVADGRSSEAYFSMIEAMRDLKVQHRIEKLVAFVGSSESNSNQKMAANIRAAGASIPDSLTLIFAGNVHATKRSVASGFPKGAASYLDASQTISLIVADMGGTGWNCQADGCRVHNMTPTGRGPRGITFGSAWLPGYDGTLSTGTNSTASPPANIQKE